MTNSIAPEKETLDQETLERKLNAVNNEFEKAKESKDVADKKLAEASKIYKESVLIHEKARATADNVFRILETTKLIEPLQERIKDLKKKGLELYKLTEKTVTEVNAAVKRSTDLEDQIKEIKDAEGTLSPDLEKDSVITNTSLAKASEDAILAYTNTIAAFKSIASVEQSLLAIQDQLTKLADNEGGIKTYFEKIAKKSEHQMEKFEKAEQTELGKSKEAEEVFNDKKEVLKALKEMKALLDSIGA